jgi:hypothetical protein
MRSILLAIGLLGLVCAPALSSPLIPSATAHAVRQSALSLLVAAKWKAAPYGWSRGRKVGWRGRGLPPGQAKKLYR